MNDVVVRVCGAPRCTFIAASSAVERAAFVLNCDAEQLTSVVLDAGQVGVRGCGQHAVYVPTRGGWILNASSLSDANAAVISSTAPAAAPPPPDGPAAAEPSP